MAVPAFLSGIHIASDQGTSKPPSARTPTRPPSNDELDAIELPDYSLPSSRSQNAATSPASPHARQGTESTVWDHAKGSKSPDELERSQPSTPAGDHAANMVPTFYYPKMNKFRVLSACMEYFGNGLNDSAPGALIPYIEKWYNIGYAVVSMIWIANAIGFIVAAFVSDLICARLGRAKTLVLSELSILVGYTVIACPVPFPVVAVAYAAIGFGQAIDIALNNVFIANLANPSVLLGYAHGSYGVGGILGPIMATALISAGLHWSRFFAIAIGVRLLNLVAVGWSFWGYEKEETSQFSNSLVQIASRQAAAGLGETSKLRIIGRALKNRTTLIGALFIFAYQGAEVSESGWFISYLIEARNANPAQVGYVTSGFWAGITLGRFLIVHLTRWVGEKRLVYAMCGGVIVFQLLCWLVPNIIAESVAVAIVGLLLGPIYPCAQTIFNRLLPGYLQVFAVGFISSMGSSGGAVVPFLTGLIAQVAGTFVLHPICIAFFIVMIVAWIALPKVEKRKE